MWFLRFSSVFPRNLHLLQMELSSWFLDIFCFIISRLMGPNFVSSQIKCEFELPWVEQASPFASLLWWQRLLVEVVVIPQVMHLRG